MYYLGLDLGQASDFTALCVIEKVYIELSKDEQAELKKRFVGPRSGKLEQEERAYVDHMRRSAPTMHALRHLRRFDIGTPYPDMVDELAEMVKSDPFEGQYKIIPDATGVGRPVIDLLRKARLNIAPIMITGGHKVTFDEGFWNVPKRELVSNLLVLMGNHRLKAAPNIPDRDILISELSTFDLTLNEKAHDVYEGRQGAHDDEVLSIALAAWYSEIHGCVSRDPPPARNPWLDVKQI